jgi:NADH:ubiquinone oxidoreductase subunit 6 (subunit J)
MLKNGFKMEFIVIGSVFIILGAVIIYLQVKIMTEQKEQKKKLNRMKI